MWAENGGTCKLESQPLHASHGVAHFESQYDRRSMVRVYIGWVCEGHWVDVLKTTITDDCVDHFHQIKVSNWSNWSNTKTHCNYLFISYEDIGPYFNFVSDKPPI